MEHRDLRADRRSEAAKFLLHAADAVRGRRCDANFRHCRCRQIRNTRKFVTRDSSHDAHRCAGREAAGDLARRKNRGGIRVIDVIAGAGPIGGRRSSRKKLDDSRRSQPRDFQKNGRAPETAGKRRQVHFSWIRLMPKSGCTSHRAEVGPCPSSLGADAAEQVRHLDDRRIAAAVHGRRSDDHGRTPCAPGSHARATSSQSAGPRAHGARVRPKDVFSTSV